MSQSEAIWQEVPRGVRLRLHVQPRSARNQIVGVYGSALKVCVTAPPADGAANEAVVQLLCQKLKVPRSTVRIVYGRRGRDKTVEILSSTPRELVGRARSMIANQVDKNSERD